MEVIFLGTGTSQGVPLIACDCAVCTSSDPRNQRSRASVHVVMDGLHIQVDATPEFRLQCLRERVEKLDVFVLTHGHADHIGDIPGLVGSLAKAGRVDPVEVWGGACEDPDLGLTAFVEHMGKAMAWDTASVSGVRPTTGFAMVGHEIPFDRPETIYERNGVTVSCFPAIHGLSGAVGYSVAYSGLKVVFSGDTRPCRHVVDAAVGADLLIHECFQSPAVYARATGLPLETALNITRLAHTVPDQIGKLKIGAVGPDEPVAVRMVHPGVAGLECLRHADRGRCSWRGYSYQQVLRT